LSRGREERAEKWRAELQRLPKQPVEQIRADS
jgi:hypothetical protein